MISHVPPEHADYIWNELEPMAERGLRHGQGDSINTDDILQLIKKGEMNLWIAHEGERLQGGMVFEVNYFPRKKVVFVVLLAGINLDEWVDEMEAMLLKYRDTVEADCIEASCRRGMAKVLFDRGWKQKAIIIQAPEVPDGQ